MTSEADLIFARANIALAKSQRLIASWLPPPTEEELRSAKTAEELDKEEEEMFKPMPELLGLGATPKDENDAVRRELSKDDILRKRLFGKDFEKMFRKDGKVGKGRQVPLGAGKPMPAEVKRRWEERVEEDEGEEEEGRSGLGRSKRSKRGEQEKVEEDERVEGKVEAGDGDDDDLPVQGMPVRPKKRSTTFLDELLAEKQRKKKKKKSKGKPDSVNAVGVEAMRKERHLTVEQLL